MADAEKPKEQELTFPKTFDKCPHCGSTRRFAEGGLKKETERAGDKETPVLMTAECIYVRGLFPVKLVAVLEVCYDCGALYAVALLKFVGAPPTIGGNGPGRLQRPR
ncbi:MAG: hypothetical protein Q8O40_03670 [Chloroflexota bacterium]|nr:hypothetical protein [Chloroflexota bacterium]